MFKLRSDITVSSLINSVKYPACDRLQIQQDRSFKVRYSNKFSEDFPQETGAPQGSILSPTLFILKMNSIVKCVSGEVDCSLYVDDLLLTCQSPNLSVAENKLQQCLNKLEVWCNKNGFKFSPTKTNCVHFFNGKHFGNQNSNLTATGSQ